MSPIWSAALILTASLAVLIMVYRMKATARARARERAGSELQPRDAEPDLVSKGAKWVERLDAVRGYLLTLIVLAVLAYLIARHPMVRLIVLGTLGLMVAVSLIWLALGRRRPSMLEADLGETGPESLDAGTSEHPGEEEPPTPGRSRR